MTVLVLSGMFHTTLSAQTLEEELKMLKDTVAIKEGGEKVLALKDVGMKFRSINVDSVRYYVDLAFKEADALDDDYYRARIWMVYGILSWDSGRPKEALEYHMKAKPILENSKEYYVLGSLYTNMSNAYEALTEFDTSVAFQFKALDMSEHIWLIIYLINEIFDRLFVSTMRLF